MQFRCVACIFPTIDALVNGLCALLCCLPFPQGSAEPLGRAFAEPEIKFVEEAYKKPALQFFDITKGKVQAGELLAAFELIELDYAHFGEVRLPGKPLLRTTALKSHRHMPD